jgi:hypothetical protein
MSRLRLPLALTTVCHTCSALSSECAKRHFVTMRPATPLNALLLLSFIVVEGVRIVEIERRAAKTLSFAEFDSKYLDKAPVILTGSTICPAGRWRPEPFDDDRHCRKLSRIFFHRLGAGKCAQELPQ